MMLLRAGAFAGCGFLATVVEVVPGAIVDVVEESVELVGSRVVVVEPASTATVVVVDVSAAAPSHAAASVRVVMSTTATERTKPLRMRTFKSFEQCVPCESRTLDAHWELDDALQCFEVAEVDRGVNF